MENKFPLVIGHRGAGHHGLENTLSSFNKAIELSVDMVEMDIQITRDKELVVFHDATLSRLGKVPIEITQANYSLLSKIKVFKHYEKYHSVYDHIPLLREVLHLLAGKIGMNIEIKDCHENNKDLVRKTLNMINDFNIREQVIISSFSSEILELIQEMDPDIRKGALFSRMPADIAAITEKYNLYSVHPNKMYFTKRHLSAAKENNLKVFIWTVNSARKMNALIKMGVDGIITNYPLKMQNLIEYLKVTADSNTL